MGILDGILNAGGGAAVTQLARQFGLRGDQASAVIGQLVPALNAGVKRNTQSQDGLASLLGALTSGNHGRYLDDPSGFARQETVNDGNAILGHIIGSKDVSREVAGRAATQTGLMAKKLFN